MVQGTKWYEITVEAELSLLPSSQSGRTDGITSKYRPNHNFGSPDNEEMRMGEIITPNGEWIEPGQSGNVLIRFIMPKGYAIELEPGLIWRIQEGSRHVGNGKIIRALSRNILNKSEHASQ